MLLQQAIRAAVLVVTISIAINATSSTEAERQMKDEVLHEFRQFDETGIITTRLSAIMNQLPLSSLFSMTPSSTSIVTRDSTICLACLSVVDAMKQYLESHSKEETFNLVLQMCTGLIGYSEDVCAGTIGLHLDSVLYIYNHTEVLPSSRICGILLQGNECSQDEPSLEWTVDVDLGPKPEVNRIGNREADAADVLTIIHLTEIHHDPIYLPAGNAECGKPMCCRSNQGNPSSPDAAAGYWGDYRSCDVPWHLFEHTLQHINNTHQKIDYIYVTGDFVDHAVWDTSIQGNTDVITNVMEQLKINFPNTPVYPVFGNHEPSPLNVFAPHYITDEKVSTKWLYKLAADLWSVWLPSETKDTILQGGFYTVLARPGFRIIALNNNVCYTSNWWLIHNPNDQDGQLKWLAETLLQAEEDGEKVHILSHIPSAGDCLRTWSREFRKIIDRFENTVTAVFNGHTHNDHFNVYYAIDEPTHPVSLAINGGSLTPSGNLNSNYKIYSVDSDTFNIQDSESWIFDLAEANKNSNVNPIWFKLYSFKDVFEVESLTASEMDKLTHKLAANRNLLEEYARFSVKRLNKGCDVGCLRSKLCSTAVGQVGDSTQCNILLEEFDTARSGSGIFSSVSSYLKSLING